MHSDKKDQLRAINKELSDLSIKFSENVLNETNDYSKQITDETQLSGLPVFEKKKLLHQLQRRLVKKAGYFHCRHQVMALSCSMLTTEA